MGGGGGGGASLLSLFTEGTRFRTDGAEFADSAPSPRVWVARSALSLSLFDLLPAII